MGCQAQRYRSPDAPQAGIDALKTQIQQLHANFAKLEMEKTRLEASVAEHRADFERERDAERIVCRSCRLLAAVFGGRSYIRMDGSRTAIAEVLRDPI
jgi:hypothetical protein